MQCYRFAYRFVSGGQLHLAVFSSSAYDAKETPGGVTDRDTHIPLFSHPHHTTALMTDALRYFSNYVRGVVEMMCATTLN